MQYLKLEEVGEYIRLNRWQVEHRCSLLAVMFHHTINHSEQSAWNGDTYVAALGGTSHSDEGPRNGDVCGGEDAMQGDNSAIEYEQIGPLTSEGVAIA